MIAGRFLTHAGVAIRKLWTYQPSKSNLISTGVRRSKISKLGAVPGAGTPSQGNTPLDTSISCTLHTPVHEGHRPMWGMQNNDSLMIADQGADMISMYLEPKFDAKHWVKRLVRNRFQDLMMIGSIDVPFCFIASLCFALAGFLISNSPSRAPTDFDSK